MKPKAEERNSTTYKHTNVQGKTHTQILRQRQIHTLANTLSPPSGEHVLWDLFSERGAILQKQLRYLSYIISPCDTHAATECKHQRLRGSLIHIIPHASTPTSPPTVNTAILPPTYLFVHPQASMLQIHSTMHNREALA